MTKRDEERGTLKTAARCAYRTKAGHQCSQPVCTTSAKFCYAHKPPARSAEQIVARRLSKAAGSLDSPAEVHGALKEIFRALVEGQLSRERAGTLGFLAQMLLRSHREIAYYEKAQLDLEAQEDEQERQRKRDVERMAERLASAHQYEAELYSTQLAQVGPDKAAELAKRRRDKVLNIAQELDAIEEAAEAGQTESKQAGNAEKGPGITLRGSGQEVSAAEAMEEDQPKAAPQSARDKAPKFSEKDAWEKMRHLVNRTPDSDERPFEARGKQEAAATQAKIQAPGTDAQPEPAHVAKSETKPESVSLSKSESSAKSASTLKPESKPKPAPVEIPAPQKPSVTPPPAPTMTIPPPRFGDFTFPAGTTLYINGIPADKVLLPTTPPPIRRRPVPPPPPPPEPAPPGSTPFPKDIHSFAKELLRRHDADPPTKT